MGVVVSDAVDKVQTLLCFVCPQIKELLSLLDPEPAVVAGDTRSLVWSCNADSAYYVLDAVCLW